MATNKGEKMLKDNRKKLHAIELNILELARDYPVDTEISYFLHDAIEKLEEAAQEIQNEICAKFASNTL